MTLPAFASAPDTAGGPASLAPGSPFTSAYSRLAEVFPSMRVLESGTRRAAAGAGWVTATELAGGGSALEELLAWEDAELLRNYGERGRPDVVASFALHRYAWPACLLMTIPWFLDRRVPRLPVDAVSFHRELGRMSVHIEEFSCLPGDPAATEPGARTVSGEDALRAELRSAVADHLGPVLEAFRPRMRRGARALWGIATDEITEGLWYLGHLLGEKERAMAETELLLPGGTTPYLRGAAFRELTGPSGEALPTRDRASCCLFYTLRPQDTCVTCPRTCDTERIERLTDTR